METLLTQLIQDIRPEHWYGFVFLGTFLLGENIILAACIFAATKPDTFSGTLTTAFLATLAADIFWYLLTVHVLAKTRFARPFRNRATADTTRLPWHIIHRSPALVLLVIKFLVGVRILLSVSIILKTRLSFRKFLLFDALGAVLFIAILGIVGWLIGTGINPSAYHILTTIVFSVVILSLLLHLLSRILFKKPGLSEPEKDMKN